MTIGPICVCDGNVSHAWGRAFHELMKAGVDDIQPLVISVSGFDNGQAVENPAIRDALDQALVASGKRTCHTVANTIFPQSTWDRCESRHELYFRYSKMVPRLRRRSTANRLGIYFERLIAFGPAGNRINQLEHIIQTRLGGNTRRSALQASVFDPHRDHTNQPRQGFPCLQHVTFAPIGLDGLAVTGFYATQYMFERAYGNYIGLCHLGQFVASEIGRVLVRMNCVTGIALLGESKAHLRGLSGQVTNLLQAAVEAEGD